MNKGSKKKTYISIFNNPNLSNIYRSKERKIFHFNKKKKNILADSNKNIDISNSYISRNHTILCTYISNHNI